MDSLRRGTAGPATGVLIGSILGAVVTAGAFTFQGHAVDEETRRAVTAVKQGIVAGHKAKDRAALIAVATGRGHLVYRNSDGSTRTSDYYSFNVFEHRDGRWSYAAAFLP